MDDLEYDASFVFTEDMLSLRDCDPIAVFARPSFQNCSLPTKEELTPIEKNWVTLKTVDPENSTPPPTKFAERLLKSQLDQFAFQMPASKEAWQNFCMYKYFELANDADPKISKPALDSLAKTSIVGLHEERQEININTKSTIELQSEALMLLRSIAKRGEEKVIEGEVL
jgi:hypothetical protein